MADSRVASQVLSTAGAVPVRNEKDKGIYKNLTT